MLAYSLLPRIAHELGLEVLVPMTGGEFGAAVVRDKDGQELVLKAVPSTRWAARIASGAQLAERLRRRNYPAPLYVATGVTGDVCWSLQERMPGEEPALMTAGHAAQLVALARLHADAAGVRQSWKEGATKSMRFWLLGLRANDAVRRLCTRIERVLDECDAPGLREGDVVHNDFSHRNYLAVGERVTGIIDWELATIGDWRLDLASLAYNAVMQPSSVSDDAVGYVLNELRKVCPPGTLALFNAYLVLRHLRYESGAHPERLPHAVSRIEAHVAPTWCHAVP